MSVCAIFKVNTVLFYEEVFTYQLLDVQGRVVDQGRFWAPTELDLNVSKLSAGWYQLQLKTDRLNQQLRLIVY